MPRVSCAAAPVAVTTPHERWLRIVTAMVAREGPELTPAGMSSACADLLGAAGVGIVVMAGDGIPGASYASNSLAAALEELQFTLGIGPRIDAYRGGVAVLGPDLTVAPAVRWDGFCGPAVAAGARAVFSFPLQVGAARLGALTVYHAEPGRLDDDGYADMLMMAEVVTRALLAAQAGLPDGAVPAVVVDERALNAVVHQASGMVSVQLGVGVGEALARLQGRAFVDGTVLNAVAGQVVARQLRFDDR